MPSRAALPAAAFVAVAAAALCWQAVGRIELLRPHRTVVNARTPFTRLRGLGGNANGRVGQSGGGMGEEGTSERGMDAVLGPVDGAFPQNVADRSWAASAMRLDPDAVRTRNGTVVGFSLFEAK